MNYRVLCMKKRIIIFSVFCLFSEVIFAVKYTITTNSSTFSPATVTATVGDIIEFVVGSGHTATQVSQSAWNNNQATPLSGGFNYNPGTVQFELTASDVGTIYYVCIPHVSVGMKGRIIVQAAANVPVTGITLNKQSVTLGVNGSETLVATIVPANATNKNVTWSTGDASTVTVDASGRVTGLKAGSAVVTVTSHDGGKIAVCTVTVEFLTGIEPENNEPATVFPNPTDGLLHLNLNEPGVYTVTIVNASGEKVYSQRIGSGNELLHIGKFPTGIYFLVIENGKQRRTFKVLKR